MLGVLLVGCRSLSDSSELESPTANAGSIRTQPQPVAFVNSPLTEQGVPTQAPTDLPPLAEEPAPPEDPSEWQPVDQVEGLAVTTIRRLYPSGKLRRIQTQLDGVEGPDGHHGLDLHLFENGVIRERAVWRQGKLEGPYQEWYEGGQISVSGEFVDGLRSGLYQEYGERGVLRMQGEYRAGRLNGEFRQWFGGGDPQEISHWIDGVQTGEHRLWDRGNTPIFFEHYAEGKREGESILYIRLPDQELPQVVGNYHAGERQGLFKEYDAEGQIVSLREYNAGALDGAYQEFVGGVQVLDTHFAAGVEVGERKEFYPSGKPFAAGQMVAGLREGLWKYWEEDGTVQATWSGWYESGQKVREWDEQARQTDDK